MLYKFLRFHWYQLKLNCYTKISTNMSLNPTVVFTDLLSITLRCDQQFLTPAVQTPSDFKQMKTDSIQYNSFK